MRRMRALAVTASVSLLLGAAACSKEETPDNPLQDKSSIWFYGTDGNMSNTFGEAFDGGPVSVGGMKGTFPLTPLTADFRNELLKVDPKLKDFSYAGEAYDAVMISAIAAELAGSVEGPEIAKQIVGVTNLGTTCKTAAKCLELASAGANVQYRGITVRNGFTEVGEPSTTTYATEHYGVSNRIEAAKTEFLNTGDESKASIKDAPKAVKGRTTDKPLTFGLLVPLGFGPNGKETPLAGQSPPVIAGARLAINQINAAGGVLGKPVAYRIANDGTDAEIAKAAIRKHHADGVQVLIGPLTSGTARKSLDEAKSRKMVMFTPSTTAAVLSSVDDGQLFFRAAPSDLLQAKAISDIMVRDGCRKIAIVLHKSDYGTGLSADARKELERAGVSSAAVKSWEYDQEIKDQKAREAHAADIARQVKEFQPDGVLIVGYEDTADVVKALVNAGINIRR